MAAKDRRANNNARQQVQREAHEIVRRFNATRQVSAQACGLAYIGVRTGSGELDYSYHEANPLGKQIPDTGIAIFDGQKRASGKDLAALPRYTA